MSREYTTKLDAFLTGLFYAGRSDIFKDKEFSSLEDLLKEPEIKVIEGVEIMQFGYMHEDTTTIEITNSKGKQCRLASTKFREGFDLWGIDPESGYAMRFN